MDNPWLHISAEDYKNHMSSPEVLQHQFLNQLFKSLYEKYTPNRLAILGCTTGNGFEHIDWSVTKRLLAIDINQKYLDEAKQKFGNHSNQIEYLCADVSKTKFAISEFDLIHTALVFEYVETEITLENISIALKKDGVFIVVLQKPHTNKGAVSKTTNESINNLSSILKLKEPDEFINSAKKFNLTLMKSRTEKLNSGKEFFVGEFKKNEAK